MDVISLILNHVANPAWLADWLMIQDGSQAGQTAPAEPSSIGQTTADTVDKIQEVGNSLNETQAVQEASAGILNSIYSLAEYMAFDAFYWVAFTLMVAGVVSFAGQLVLTKLLLLFKLNLNIKEILGDLLGLVVSLVGLVLTTQAATENSDFPSNAIAVVSATLVGALVGFVFYLWGQQTEFDAANTESKE